MLTGAVFHGDVNLRADERDKRVYVPVALTIERKNVDTQRAYISHDELLIILENLCLKLFVYIKQEM